MRDEIKIFCNSCRHLTWHNTLFPYEQMTEEGEVIHWKVVQCAGCDEVSFLEQHFVGTDSEQQLLSELVYPPRLKRVAKQIDGLPAKLDRIYREMIDAFNNQSYILCAGGLRSLVEGICAEQNIKDGPKRNHETGEYEVDKSTGEKKRGTTLDCKIEELSEKNILPRAYAQALHEHRFLGNSALHELEAPGVDMIALAITIIEHVMESLYNLPAQAGSLMRMRAANPRQNRA